MLRRVALVRSVMARDPDEVPLVAYLRQVEAAGEFPSPTGAQQIWTAIGSAPNGAAVVGKFEMVNEPAQRGG